MEVFFTFFLRLARRLSVHYTTVHTAQRASCCSSMYQNLIHKKKDLEPTLVLPSPCHCLSVYLSLSLSLPPSTHALSLFSTTHTHNTTTPVRHAHPPGSRTTHTTRVQRLPIHASGNPSPRHTKAMMGHARRMPDAHPSIPFPPSTSPSTPLRSANSNIRFRHRSRLGNTSYLIPA
ncbi:uncharacterized protein K452DRAFT_87049 [Aplosporella prunicola CBS 121167]|uniref:Uncharacterized protein n=1 Tax=Aplosporella prunicola CBS 121167 TaxID=1176127 RepID=A0A6A6B3S2_9PEZI|nr:uncharacterized protein K452DRAFT_87049 [Aplosporella prunicola CBS 121167]KAF2138466.1 hypothetical protein K452DRAFT_87049 [Aplosporella prunicola CBS 121167]